MNINNFPFAIKELINLYAFSTKYEDYIAMCTFNLIQDYQPSIYSSPRLQNQKEYWNLQLDSARMLFYASFIDDYGCNADHETTMKNIRYIDNLLGDDKGHFYLVPKKYQITVYSDCSITYHMTDHKTNATVTTHFDYNEIILQRTSQGFLTKSARAKTKGDERTQTSAEIISIIQRILNTSDMCFDNITKDMNDVTLYFDDVSIYCISRMKDGRNRDFIDTVNKSKVRVHIVTLPCTEQDKRNACASAQQISTGNTEDYMESTLEEFEMD